VWRDESLCTNEKAWLTLTFDEVAFAVENYIYTVNAVDISQHMKNRDKKWLKY